MSPLARKSYLINVPILLHMSGWLIFIESLFMLIPLGTAIIYDDHDIVGFAVSTGITALAGLILIRLKPANRQMGRRDAILLTGLAWVILTLFGLIPYILSGAYHTFADAFLESINNFTSTGATILGTNKGLSHSVLMWRSLQRWIGGLGIILITLAIAPMLNNPGGIQLFNAEGTGITKDKLRPRISSTAKGLLLVYGILTLVLILLLCISPMSVFDSICNGLSTIATGGLAALDSDDILWHSSYVKIIFTIFMTIGGINFSLIYMSFSGHLSPLKRNTPLRWYLIGILLGYLVFVISRIIHDEARDISDILIDPLFQSASILSTSGVIEPDFQKWGPISVIVVMVMLFVGACAGSTSSGAKMDRIIILIRFLKNEFYRLMHPSAVRAVSINGKGVSYVIVQKALGFLWVYVIVIIVGTLILAITGLPLKDSALFCLASISNSGVDSIILGHQICFINISEIAKWILSFIMLVGRLELYTVLLIFTPYFWKE